MYHTSQNSFRSYYNGYPFKENIIDKASEVEETSDETIIAAGQEQIEAILTMKPFDPEEFGFKRSKNEAGDEQYAKLTDIIHCLMRRDEKIEYGYWNIVLTNQDSKQDHQVIPLYIPNDTAGRIILTGLGIVDRKDVQCEDDADRDGVCLICENVGTCQKQEAVK